MLKVVLLVIVMAAVFVILYDRGYMIHNSKTAASYVGSGRGNGARFAACSGSIKRIVRFKEDGVSTFVLDLELSKGELSVELYDSAKQKVLHLNRENRKASVFLEQGKKYTLVVRFRSATGRYSLTRE